MLPVASEGQLTAASCSQQLRLLGSILIKDYTGAVLQQAML